MQCNLQRNLQHPKKPPIGSVHCNARTCVCHTHKVPEVNVLQTVARSAHLQHRRHSTCSAAERLAVMCLVPRCSYSLLWLHQPQARLHTPCHDAHTAAH